MLDVIPEPYRAVRKQAARLSRKMGLALPVPIDEVIAEFADVVQADIPSRCDALVALSADGSRPTVFVQRSVTSRHRQRFTLAHELGHIRIGWHCGLMPCHVAESLSPNLSGRADEHYRNGEWEANAYASEILIPTTWLGDQWNGPERIAELTEHVAGEADVSLPVAAIGIADRLEGGHAWAIVDDGGYVRFAGRSAGTRTPWIAPGTRLDERDMSRFSTEQEYVVGRRKILWWRFESVDVAPDRPALLSKEYLRIIMDDLGVPTGKIRTTWGGRVNGVVGGWNNVEQLAEVRTTIEALRQRFAVRPHLRDVMDHPNFDDWIAAKAYELSDKYAAET